MEYRVPDDAIEVGAQELRKELRNWLERVAYREDELVITRSGKPMAALISMDAYLALRKLIRPVEESIDAAAVLESREEEDFMPLDEVLKPDGS